MADATTIAREAYVFGYPLVLMDRMRAATGAGVGRFAHARELPGSRGAPISPVTGLLRSAAWLDLGPQPVVLSVPDTYGRWCALALVDAWGGVFASVGSRTTGSRRGEYAVCGPAAQDLVPEGMTAIRSPTRMVWIVGGIQVDRASAYADAHAVQAGFGLRPLGERPGTPVRSVQAARRARTPVAEVEAMPPEAFFARMAELMRDNPAQLQDRVIVERMTALGLVADDGGHLWSLPAQLRAAVARGVRQGRAEVAAHAPPGERVGGWWLPFDRARTYLDRASAARAGFQPAPAEDELPAVTSADARGRPLSGRHRYRLRFADGSPVVHGFWTLTTCDGSQPPVGDPVEPCSVLDWNGLVLDDDGALTVDIGPPGDDRPANWLPSPDGPFTLVLRLHWPAGEVFERTWTPPPVRRIS